MAHLVYSFAVFDTCLLRMHARPLDQLFALAAQVLPPGAGRDDHHEFARMRLAAEDEARDGPGLEAAGLGRVYELFPSDNPWGLEPEALYITELELSLAGTRPVRPVLERVRGHIRRGERVVYVTDSILPGASLRRLLESHGFAGEVYAAGDLGKRKQSGALYLHAAAAQSVEPGKMLHTGADPILDISAPRSVGVDAEPFPQARFTAQEEYLASLSRACDIQASRTVAASRAARLRNEPAPGQERLRAFAASVAGPVLTAFAAWTLAEAGSRGAERLYFLAREGELPCRVAQAIQPLVGGPEPRYLMGSLSAWTAPLAAGVGRADLDWLAAEGQPRSPADILSRLSLTPEELIKACGRRMPELFSDTALDAAGLDRLWELLDEPGSRRLLASKAATARELALAHLKQQGALDASVLSVADMGWTLSTQRSLRMLLAGTGVDVEGWYFGLASSRLGRLEAGPHHALFVERTGQAAPGSLEPALFRSVRLMECAFTRPSHGRVTGYKASPEGVVPALGPEPSGLELSDEIAGTVLEYASALAEGGLGERTLAALQETAANSLRRFLTDPGNCLARAVASLPECREGARPVLRKLGVTDVAQAWLKSLGMPVRPGRPPAWLEGSAALASAWLRPYLRRPRLMALLRDYFS